MILNDVLKFQEKEGIITYLRNNYLECINVNSKDKLIVSEDDWFKLYYKILEDGLKSIIIGSDKPIDETFEMNEQNKIIIYSRYVEEPINFIESRNLLEGKIFQVVTRGDSDFKDKRVIIENVDIEEQLVEIRTDEVNEKDTITLYLDVLNGISKNKKENEILDFKELDDDDDIDSELDLNELKNLNTEEEYRIPYDKRIPIEEKELSDEEKYDQLIFELRKNFDWDFDSEITFNRVIKLIFNESFMEHDCDITLKKWYHDAINLNSKSIIPIIGKIDDKKKSISEEDYSSDLEKYKKSDISYHNFIKYTLQRLRLIEGPAQKIKYDTLAYSNNEFLSLLSNKIINEKDRNKSNNTNMFTKKTELHETCDMIKRPLKYMVDDKKNTKQIKRVPPNIDSFRDLLKNYYDGFKLFNTTIHDIPFQYLLKIQKNDMKRNLKMYHGKKLTRTQDNEICKEEITNKNFSKVDINLIKENFKPLGSDGNKIDKYVLSDIKQNIDILKWDKSKYWPSQYLIEILNEKLNINNKESAFLLHNLNKKQDKTDNNYIDLKFYLRAKQQEYQNDILRENDILKDADFKTLASTEELGGVHSHGIQSHRYVENQIKSKHNRSLIKWRKIEFDEGKKEDKKLELIFAGKYLRCAFNDENPFYLYDVYTSTPTIPRHEISKLKIDKSKFQKSELIDCLKNEWCFYDEEKYYSIINNELLLQSSSDDYGFGESASFIDQSMEKIYNEFDSRKLKDIRNVEIKSIFEGLLIYLHATVIKYSARTFDDNFKEGAVSLFIKKLEKRVEWLTYQSIKRCVNERKFIQTEDITKVIHTVFSQSGNSENTIESYMKKWLKQVKNGNDENIENFLNLVIEHALVNLIHREIGTIVSSYLYTSSQIEFKKFSSMMKKSLDGIEPDDNSNLRWIYGYSSKPKDKYKDEFVFNLLKNFHNGAIQYWGYNSHVDFKKFNYNYNKLNLWKRKDSEIVIRSSLQFSTSVSDSNMNFKENLSFEKKEYLEMINEDKRELLSFWKKINIEKSSFTNVPSELEFLVSSDVDKRCYKQLILKALQLLLTKDQHNSELKFKMFEVWKIYKSDRFAEKIKEWIRNEKKCLDFRMSNDEADILNIIRNTYEEELLNLKLYIVNLNTNIFSHEIFKNIMVNFVETLIENTVSNVGRVEQKSIILKFFEILYQNINIVCGSLISERKNLELVAESQEDEASTYITKNDDDKKDKQIDRLERSKHLGRYAKGALHQASGVSLEDVTLESDSNVDDTRLNYETNDGLENIYESAD